MLNSLCRPPRFDVIDPTVVHCEHGWWSPELPEEELWLHDVWESNVNVLIDDDPDNCDPIGGAWPLKGMLCRIYKIKQSYKNDVFKGMASGLLDAEVIPFPEISGESTF